MPDDRSGSSPMSEEALASALLAAREKVARVERERVVLERAVAAAREEERLWGRLLALRKGVIKQDEPGGASSRVGADNNSGLAPSKEQVPVESRHPVVQVVVEELAAAGRPVHLSELMRILRDRGVPIPGSGTQANLITHLRRDSRLVRPSRGMYGLAVWGLEDMPTTKGRRRKKRIRVKATVERGEWK